MEKVKGKRLGVFYFDFIPHYVTLWIYFLQFLGSNSTDFLMFNKAFFAFWSSFCGLNNMESFYHTFKFFTNLEIKKSRKVYWIEKSKMVKTYKFQSFSFPNVICICILPYLHFSFARNAKPMELDPLSFVFSFYARISN